MLIIRNESEKAFFQTSRLYYHFKGELKFHLSSGFSQWMSLRVTSVANLHLLFVTTDSIY